MAETEGHDVCPVWVGYLLASPIRALFQNPQRILAPYVRPGMRVIDVGSAMGFFSLPLARMVGPKGRVICIDLQQRMLDALAHRAEQAQLAKRVELRVCSPAALPLSDLDGQIDFALLFAVVHETRRAAGIFAELHEALKPGARVLFAEPRGHVDRDAFQVSIDAAGQSGFRPVEHPRIARSHAVVLEK
jgi:ubiquinone/menaquinone biosynthesis C-methylase UbiE